MSDDELRFLSNALNALDTGDQLKRVEEQHRKELRGLLRDMLGVVDALRDLERHCLDIEATAAGTTQLRNVQTITKMMLRLLATHDVRAMDATGCDLNLEHHEVVKTVAEDGTPADIVVSEQQHGYLIGRTVLRQAKVVVSR